MFGRKKGTASANGDARVSIYGGKGNTVNITVNNTVNYTHNGAPLFIVKFKTRHGVKEIPVRAKNFDDVENHMPQIKAQAEARGLPVSNNVEVAEAVDNRPVEGEVNVVK